MGGFIWYLVSSLEVLPIVILSSDDDLWWGVPGASSIYYVLWLFNLALLWPTTLKVLVRLPRLTLPVLVTGVRMNIANERGRALQIRFV